MARFIQDPVTHKLIPAEEYRPPEVNRTAYVQGDIESFVSPVTHEVIDDRGKLRRHNKQHGVTNVADYGAGWFERKTQERHAQARSETSRDKQDRRQALLRAADTLNRR